MPARKPGEIKIGDEFTLVKRVGEDQTRTFAEVSGDFNPIHLDPDFAREAGLDGIIVHGLCTMSYLVQCVTDWAGDPGCLKKIKTRFPATVWPGDTITCKGTVAAIEGGRVRCDLVATNQHREKVISRAWAELEFKESDGG